jgi:DNA-binding response OmpR family regulator
MDDFADQYRRRLGARIEALESAYRTLQSAPGEAIPLMRRLAHTLRGSGATFGFPDITIAATAMESATDADIGQASLRLVDVLRQVAAGAVITVLPLVLIVDDDAAVSALLAATLASNRWQIRTAVTVQEAEDVLRQGDVSLVVLDLVLPDEDGRRLLGRLRRDPRTASVPIFIVSANLGEQIKTECFALGADGYFEKPLDSAVIRQVVEERIARGGGHPKGASPVQSVAAPPPQVAPHAPQPGLRANPALRVLLAEDDEMVASVVIHRLGREGFEVRHFADGRLALEAAQQDTSHCAVLDLKLPGIDGFTLLRSLRALPAWSNTPVLILTSLGSEKDLMRGFALGANDYVTKPFSPLELVARVKRLVLT